MIVDVEAGYIYKNDTKKYGPRNAIDRNEETQFWTPNLQAPLIQFIFRGKISVSGLHFHGMNANVKRCLLANAHLSKNRLKTKKVVELPNQLKFKTKQDLDWSNQAVIFETPVETKSIILQCNFFPRELSFNIREVIAFVKPVSI